MPNKQIARAQKQNCEGSKINFWALGMIVAGARDVLDGAVCVVFQW